MANSWLRLWHDMPNDPKWRTIARQSGRPISLVIAVYTHLMVDASRNVTRGHVNVTQEDLASALDVTEDDVGAVLGAMEGRVIENNYLLGWEKRQPKREDSWDGENGAKPAAVRKREQREREKAEKEKEDVTQCHAESHNVTLDKDKDKDKELHTLSPLQAKTDHVPNRLNGKTQMVSDVMAYLNLQARRNYRVSNPNGTPTAGALVIAQRLKEGYTVEQCKDVIGEKSNQWMGDEKMDQYLNPQTLFRKSNFDKYLTEAEAQR